jgi:methylated-DNA-[protein]-cysteine S-methyltransferase
MWQTDSMLEWIETELVDGPRLRLFASPAGIRAIEFVHPDSSRPVPPDARHATGPVPLLLEAKCQLEAYFHGDLREFQLPLDFEGTDFQKRVWRQLQTIPYGQTRSYSQIAQAIGSPQAIRAVGAANGANPIAIVVPCHRVIGANGKLVGYGGGLPLKKKLLELEGVVTASLYGIAP